jgi:hypothetical protein
MGNSPERVDWGAIVLTISFEREDKELILCYSPEMGTDEIADRLSSGKEVWIKHTFVVNKSLLRDSDSSDYEDNLRFCIGSVDDSYTLLNPEVIKTDHKFFFSNDIKLKQSMFVAYRNISILRKIDALVERDIYVGGSWDARGGMPFEAYQSLIESFPKTAELDKYANSRIALCIKEYFPECDKYEQIYERFLTKGKRLHSVSGKNDEIELAQFSAALEELKQLLNNGAGINEADWQIRIRDILQLLYPKFILCTREITFSGIDGYDKRPDFVLVDANGYVDILEIKKPDVLILTKQASYRNNYVPVREFSGAIQQIEKYIFCMTSIEKSQREVKNKLVALLPEAITPEIVNPQGILIAGRSKGFNPQQKRDFELIKRQYKHVADIMTYDDLVARFENIVMSLKKRIPGYEELC